MDSRGAGGQPLRCPAWRSTGCPSTRSSSTRSSCSCRSRRWPRSLFVGPEVALAGPLAGAACSPSAACRCRADRGHDRRRPREGSGTWSSPAGPHPRGVGRAADDRHVDLRGAGGGRVLGAARTSPGSRAARTDAGGAAALEKPLMVLVPLAAVAVLVLVVLTGDAGPRRSGQLGGSVLARRPRGSRAAAGTTAPARPAVPVASSSPHSGSPSPWVQPRGQSSVRSSRSGKASISWSGSTWASPKERMPGVSTIQPPPGRASIQRAGRGVPPAPGHGVDHADLAERRRAPAR